MASPPFGAIGSLTNVNGTTSVTRPAVSAGDLMLLGVVAVYGDATITPPAGWTALASIDQGSAFEFELRLYWKIAGGSEPSTYSVGIGGQGGGNNIGYGWIWTYTGPDGTTPVPVSATQRNTSNSTSATCPSVTTTAADQTLVCVYVSGSNSISNSWTPPSGMTERMDAGSNPSGFVVGIADVAVASAGATGTKTATQTSSATSNCISFAVASVPPAASFSGTVTLDDVSPTGSFSTVPNGSFSGSVTLDDASPSGSFSRTPGTITSDPLKNNDGFLLASLSLDFVCFYDDSTNALVLRKTGVSTNASGIFTITDAALQQGVTYRIDWQVSTGDRRMPRRAAT